MLDNSRFRVQVITREEGKLQLNNGVKFTTEEGHVSGTFHFYIMIGNNITMKNLIKPNITLIILSVVNIFCNAWSGPT